MATLQHHIESIQRYVNHGLEPGSCTRAILENNLIGAFKHADPSTTELMSELVKYVYNNVPPDAWGSAEKVSTWIGLKRSEREWAKKNVEGVR